MTAEASIIVYGTTWCPDCRRATRFLDEHHISYTWIDIDQDRVARAEVERLNRGMRSVPTILFPDGSMLVEPRNDALAAKFSLPSTAARTG
jgi:mycoredoxin